MDKYQTLKLFDYSIFTSSLDEFDINYGTQCVINTLNQYCYIIAEKDAFYKRALIESDLLIPDGIGIVGAAKILKREKIKKIAGADMHTYLLKQISKTGGRVFYLGSSEETLLGIKKRLAIEYPNIEVDTYSPPFKAKFNDADNAAMIESINKFNPDALFVGMTAPKQEKWVFEHKHKLNAQIICSIGAVFDFYAETVKRPSKFWINLGLEWFIRLLHEPNHLWRRYLLYGPVFIYVVFREKLRLVFNGQKQMAD
ncbi:WecB/TagA/CpsF family glycosyltransferase [Mucilaginibacter pedocola]|uniref:N-acetylglucosaminyldiphospho-UDP N-acetyl-beta-D-mannosaminyltransferase n=1 Tax=Mucilaginibacter pedocola TaxID=1792845 RepID=A0A1S9P809_9SPHI|nr:WecB/TagA/CpsF family glycosyltransferase [Mucilaginibacter pedocola]OOQ57103.1 N-acetylglucosaminyldiphospho-UDP N-acetyl-beta-D-mannosaminyltransferase [Mucilaginibacter pedocola]